MKRVLNRRFVNYVIVQFFFQKEIKSRILLHLGITFMEKVVDCF
jgi:hypothetical protein